MERNNKQTCVKLFAENSNSTKDAAPAPIASFVTKLLISFPPNQKTIVHPGKFLLLIEALCYSLPVIVMNIILIFANNGDMFEFLNILVNIKRKGNTYSSFGYKNKCRI